MTGFLTGSRAYGAPLPESDVDLVILLDEQASDALNSVAEWRGGSSNEFIDSVSYKIGSLDLIVCEDVEFFEKVWKRGTDELVARKPVSRDDAVTVFKSLMKDFWEMQRQREEWDAGIAELYAAY